MRHLVSIIIPTFNRAHLIEETLESVLSQTYTNWECIVVDDGSKDGTGAIVESFILKNNRFKYFIRPNHKKKGGNSCRNYGFELSKGYYIKWFDSDDIMLPNHLKILVSVLERNNLDFVVGDSINFIPGEEIDKKPYCFDRKRARIDADQYAKQKIGWITDDFLCRRIAVMGISFNENLRAGQEYNFFIRFLLKNPNGILIDQVLTMARLHNDSLSHNILKDKRQHKKIIAEIKLLTLEDTFQYGNENLNNWLLSGYIQMAFTLALDNIKPPYIKKGIYYVWKIKNLRKAISFVVSLNFSYFLGIGYVFNKYSKK